MIETLIPRAQRYRFLPEGQGSGGLLPWVIAVMVFLTALALAGGIGLATATEGLSQTLGRTVTVQIVNANPDVRARQADAVMQAIERDPGIARAVRLTDNDIDRLLEPWLGEGNVGDDLPLPTLIDLELTDPDRTDLAALTKTLQAVAPDARVDDQARWLGPLAGLVGTLQWIAAAIVLLVAAAMVAVVALGTRSGLNVYRPTIEVLHLMGAEDVMIARLFQYRYLRYGLAGGIIGLVFALIAILIVGQLVARMGSGLVGDVGLPADGWLAIALLPIAAGLLTMITARLTVSRALAAYL